MRTFLYIAGAAAVAACSGTPQTCESIEEVLAQERYCKDLRQKIQTASRLQIASALREQYQQECIEFRYYRDNFDSQSICTLDDKLKQEPKTKKSKM